MSTYESYVESFDVDSEERFVRSMADQNEKIAAFLAEYQRRCELVDALEEQNRLIKNQIDFLANENSVRRKELETCLESTSWELSKAVKELEQANNEVDKYREYIEELEKNNEYLKRQCADNELLILESKGKIENLRETAIRTEEEIEEVVNETERVTVQPGASKSLSLTITRKLEAFEDLAKEVENLRGHNQDLLNRISELQKEKQKTERVVTFRKEQKLEAEEDKLNIAVSLKNELEMVREMTATQENLVESLQVDLETLREENAYLTERVKKRGIQLEYSSLN